MTIYDLRTNRAPEAPMNEVKHPNNYTAPDELYVDILLSFDEYPHTLEFGTGSLLYKLFYSPASAGVPIQIRSAEVIYNLVGVRLNPAVTELRVTREDEEVQTFQLVYRAVTA